jgi:hypothetical protein
VHTVAKLEEARPALKNPGLRALAVRWRGDCTQPAQWQGGLTHPGQADTNATVPPACKGAAATATPSRRSSQHGIRRMHPRRREDVIDNSAERGDGRARGSSSHVPQAYIRTSSHFLATTRSLPWCPHGPMADRPMLPPCVRPCELSGAAYPATHEPRPDAETERARHP